MSKGVLYHNITTLKFNLDLEELIESMESSSDIIVVTVSGNMYIAHPGDNERGKIIDAYRSYHSEEDNS